MKRAAGCFLGDLQVNTFLRIQIFQTLHFTNVNVNVFAIILPVMMTNIAGKSKSLHLKKQISVRNLYQSSEIVEPT